jgi:hypothetical protein
MATRPRGRPPKPEKEVYIKTALRFPPALWAELCEQVPEGERSAFLHRALERELKRLRREKAKAANEGDDATKEGEK